MNESTIVAASNRYDRWDISFDLLNDTVSADYFSFATSTLTNLVSGVSMMNAMDDITDIYFRTSDGVNNAKLLSVDDFGFTTRQIPAPASAALLALGGIVARRRR